MPGRLARVGGSDCGVCRREHRGVRRVDTLVVGAGVVGCTTAWQLARRGREVVVLEAATVASGASGGPGRRGIRANGRDPRELPLARRAHELWPELADAVDAETGFDRIGHLQLTERREDLARFEARAVDQTAAGIATELVGQVPLAELEPELSDRVVGALHCPADGVADHTATTIGLAAAARAAGAEIIQHTAVTQLAPTRDGRVRVHTGVGERRNEDGEGVEAGSVVVAANAGTALLLAGLGVAVPLVTVHPQVLLTVALPEPPVRHVLGHEHRPLALKALPDGRVMVTGGRLGRLDPRTGRAEVDPEEVRANLRDAAAVVPELDDTRVEVATADRAESVSPDLVAIVDRVPDAPCWVAAGWTGHGFALAPAIGEALAAWVLTGRRPGVVAPLGLPR